jgi:hypothetical protein
LRIKWRAREDESIAEDGQRVAEKRASKGEGDDWQGLGPGFRLLSARVGRLFEPVSTGRPCLAIIFRERGGDAPGCWTTRPD